jgi:DsbC/DsbD-like thiol-disulfide interchange protein
VVPEEAGKPVTLRLDAFYGACREVCIPVQAEAAVTLEPGAAPDPVARVAVERYRPLVPAEPQPGAFDIEAVRRDGSALLIEVLAPDGIPLDLFAVGPEGWYLGQPELLTREGTAALFRLKLDGMPPGASLDGATFRFVAVSGGRAIEEVMVIPPEALDG